MTFQQFQENFDRLYDYWHIMLGTAVFYLLLYLSITVFDYSIGKFHGKSLFNLHARSTNKGFLIGNHLISMLFNIQFLIFTVSYHNPFPWYYSNPNTKYTNENDRINFAIIAGYFSYDTIALLIHMLFVKGSRMDAIMIFHHFFAVFANMYGITQDIDGYFMIQGTLWLESSSPFYHLYRIIQHTKYDLGLFDLFNKILFFTSYTFLRLLCGMHLCWYLWYNSKSAYCQLLGNLGGIISLIWYKEIMIWLYNNVINPNGNNKKTGKKNC